MHYIHVAKDGNDQNAGTLDAPVATVFRAQELVRAHTATMESDIIVTVHPGIYFLHKPLRLDSSHGDSGENGHKVVYQSHDRTRPAILSGGRQLRSWQSYDKKRNIWVAEVDDLVVRQLYINGQSVPRAELKTVPPFATKTDSGYEVASIEPQWWGNAGDIEFRYAGVYPWSEAIIGVQSVSGDSERSMITMKQPAFAWANKLYKSSTPDTEEWAGVDKSKGLDQPTSILNGLGFLTEPGTFVFDSRITGKHKVYYIPRSDEDMAIAECIVPVLETLIEGQGSVNVPLHDIVFRDLTFMHATWNRPSSPEGYVHYHGVSYYQGGRVQSFEWSEGASVTIPIQYKLSPSAIAWCHANAIEFTNNHFTNMGTGMLCFSVGSSDNIIRGNIFNNAGSTGLTIGTESSTHKPGAVKTANNQIEQNRFSHLGGEFHGSPAILVVKTQNTIIDHNEVTDMPHAGIVVYGGGKTRGLRITHNRIARTMRSLADGGGIYVSTSQGTSAGTGAVISGNVVEDTITPYNFAIYTDYGADWTVIRDNIIRNADNPVAIQTAPPLSNVTIRGNFWDSEPYGIDAVPYGVTVVNNRLLQKDTFKDALESDEKMREIYESAGMS